jgi:isoamylase
VHDLIVRPGHHYPLGATLDESGANFAIFSEHATAVDLCLFDDAGNERRVRLPQRTLHVFHGHVAGIRAGQRYGFRVHGPYEPRAGHRFNPHKLLVDPYARQIDGKADFSGPVFGYCERDHVADVRDDARFVPKSVVFGEPFDWEGDDHPGVDWHDVVLYEMHVKGFTKLHPDVPEAHRGTFLGLAAPAAIEHLRALGVTTVELLPVHECMDEMSVAGRGMTNYWGYQTLSYFAPDQRFASRRGHEVREFKQMVKALHRAGIEVVLDVVYNHTCEGDHIGHTVSLKGIDNRVYYQLAKDDPAKYLDFTGCGNSLNVAHPQTLKLIMDSLRYWVTEMHVDGFRFDLASTLAREGHGVDKLSAFFDIIHQDPILSRVKLIAEPWDLGEGGYQVGNFPLLWTEWNGRFRDTVRRFWTGHRGVVGDLGYRLTGSSDLFADDGRHPHASINFITAHDGFTLHDLVRYEKKHNEANGESNRDGSDDNAAWNCGVEGDSDDREIEALRARQVRNLFATLVLSQGMPMISMGDEMGRTQRGNNNAYVQDNEISWVDWDLSIGDRQQLLEFARRLLSLRRQHAAFRRRRFFTGDGDIAWLRRDGTPMTVDDWQRPASAFIAFMIDGKDTGVLDPSGRPAKDATFYVAMNGSREPVAVALPPGAWELVLTTSAKCHVDSGKFTLEACSLALVAAR